MDAQLYLFGVQDVLNESIIPDSGMQIVEAVGLDAFKALYRANPNAKHRTLYVPQSLSHSHWIVKAIGLQKAEELRRAFGGEMLTFPKCSQAIALAFARNRAEEVRRLYRSGHSKLVKEIAERVGLTTRRVQGLISTLKNENLKSENSQ